MISTTSSLHVCSSSKFLIQVSNDCFIMIFKLATVLKKLLCSNEKATETLRETAQRSFNFCGWENQPILFFFTVVTVTLAPPLHPPTTTTTLEDNDNGKPTQGKHVLSFSSLQPFMDYLPLETWSKLGTDYTPVLWYVEQHIPYSYNDVFKSFSSSFTCF